MALLERRAGGWERVACAGPKPCDNPDDADVDVPVTADVHLALRGRALPAQAQGVLETVAGQALLALRHQRMRHEAADARRRAETTELRTALLSAVGHDLRTPLTSIKAAVGSLRAPDLRLSEEDSAELLATIEESADRLAGLVGNLLDSSRLATGAVRPLLRAVTYDEVVARALSGVDGRAEVALDRDVDVAVDVDEALPPVLADPGLLERVVANVVDNALRHGRPRRPVAPGEPAIAVRASAHGRPGGAAGRGPRAGAAEGQRGHGVRAVPAARRHVERRRARHVGGEGLHRRDGWHDPDRGHAGRWAHRGDLAAGGR